VLRRGCRALHSIAGHGHHRRRCCR
jgi:hypothetical protein